MQLLNEQHEEVLRQEAFLNSTDYIAAKLAEDVATKAEYTEKLAAREAARVAIRAAQAEIERLEAIETEDPVGHDPMEE